MNAATANRLAWFFGEMWQLFLDGGSIDGSDVQTAVEKSGLAVWRPATADQAAAANCDIEAGEPLLTLTTFAREAMTSAPEPRPWQEAIRP